LDQMPFLNSVFAVIEHITRAELTNTSKRLVISYINQSTNLPLLERALQAVVRYTQAQLPAEDPAMKSLMLNLESEASRLQQG
jgi:hypothetical protein